MILCPLDDRKDFDRRKYDLICDEFASWLQSHGGTVSSVVRAPFRLVSAVVLRPLAHALTHVVLRPLARLLALGGDLFVRVADVVVAPVARWLERSMSRRLHVAMPPAVVACARFVARSIEFVLSSFVKLLAYALVVCFSG